jgi:hypothetical protein
MPPSQLVQSLCDVPHRRFVNRSRGGEGKGEEAGGYVDGAGLA